MYMQHVCPSQVMLVRVVVLEGREPKRQLVLLPDVCLPYKVLHGLHGTSNACAGQCIRTVCMARSLKHLVPLIPEDMHVKKRIGAFVSSLSKQKHTSKGDLLCRLKSYCFE